MEQNKFTIKENIKIAENTYLMRLYTDCPTTAIPGQFVNIKLDGFYLRRPISVCDIRENELTVIYKAVGRGTEYMMSLKNDTELDVLTGLGNGYDTSLSGNSPVLLGGGAGVPPMFLLARELLSQGKQVTAILGFNTANEVFFESQFKEIGADVIITTADGSVGTRGFVTDALKTLSGYSYTFACGPEPMLKAVYNASLTSGQYSFEERMGCGFGACMGCSCKTKYGNKRICKDGPVLVKEEIIW